MKITPKIALEVIQHEGFVREAYKDSKGIWTWGFGVTSRSGHDVERYRGKPQSVERCVEIYLWLLQKYLDDVAKAFHPKELTEDQAAAALSFHWNTGAIGKASWVRRWKAGDIAGARTAFMWYRKPKEIIGRRRKERDLFFGNRKLDPSEHCIMYRRVTRSGRPVEGTSFRIGPVVRDHWSLTPVPEDKQKPTPKPGFWQSVISALARMFK